MNLNLNLNLKMKVFLLFSLFSIKLKNLFFAIKIKTSYYKKKYLLELIRHLRKFLIALSFRLRVFLRKNGLYCHHINYHSLFFILKSIMTITYSFTHLFLFAFLILNYKRVFLILSL